MLESLNSLIFLFFSGWYLYLIPVGLIMFILLRRNEPYVVEQVSLLTAGVSLVLVMGISSVLPW